MNKKLEEKLVETLNRIDKYLNSGKRKLDYLVRDLMLKGYAEMMEHDKLTIAALEESQNELVAENLRLKECRESDCELMNAQADTIRRNQDGDSVQADLVTTNRILHAENGGLKEELERWKHGHTISARQNQLEEENERLREQARGRVMECVNCFKTRECSKLLAEKDAQADHIRRLEEEKANCRVCMPKKEYGNCLLTKWGNAFSDDTIGDCLSTVRSIPHLLQSLYNRFGHPYEIRLKRMNLSKSCHIIEDKDSV